MIRERVADLLGVKKETSVKTYLSVVEIQVDYELDETLIRKKGWESPETIPYSYKVTMPIATSGKEILKVVEMYADSTKVHMLFEDPVRIQLTFDRYLRILVGR